MGENHVALSELPCGAVFQTKDGVRAVKSKYHYTNGGIECVLIPGGEYAHFANTAKDHNATVVREVAPIYGTSDAVEFAARFGFLKTNRFSGKVESLRALIKGAEERATSNCTPIGEVAGDVILLCSALSDILDGRMPASYSDDT